jgi:hypothetical protein
VKPKFSTWIVSPLEDWERALWRLTYMGWVVGSILGVVLFVSRHV